MTLRMTEEEYRDFLSRRGQGARIAEHDAHNADGGRRASKYGNRRTEVDGMKFDSRREADYYFGTLVPLAKAGALKLLIRQAPFDLPGGIRYIADFVCVTTDGHVRVIDVKSPPTRNNRVYINKKKQMKACWGIEIEEVQ